MADAFTDAQKRELLRLVAGVRSLMGSSVALTAPREVLAELADATEAVAVRAAEHAGDRPFPRYSRPIDGDLNTIIPWSVITGRYNPMAAPVTMTLEDGKVIGTVELGLAYEGPPSSVHGAIVTGIWDQVLAFAAMANQTPGHTASLTTRFRSLTPLHTELRFEAWVDRIDGRKIFTSGACYANGDVVTEAEGLFIEYKIPGSTG